MRALPILTVSLSLIASTTLSAGAGDEHRHMDAHEHGRGTLNIAIVGDIVSMELVAPGADIVGFEHAATSEEDKATVAKAKATLSKPLTLFSPPAAAACKTDTHAVSIATESHDEHNDHKDHGHADKGHHDHEPTAHSEFRAEYTLRCAAPEKLTSLQFKFFDAFGGAQKLDVAIITATNQSKFEVTRAKPTIDLAGLM